MKHAQSCRFTSENYIFLPFISKMRLYRVKWVWSFSILFSRLSQIRSKQWHVSITQHSICSCVALFILNTQTNVFFTLFQVWHQHANACATKTSEPKLSQSERVEDLTSCGLLEKENVWLFSVFFYTSCLWDRDAVLRVCVADLLVWSRLNFVADFVHVWKLLINRCTQRHVRSDENETEVGTWTQ